MSNIASPLQTSDDYQFTILRHPSFVHGALIDLDSPSRVLRLEDLQFISEGVAEVQGINDSLRMGEFTVSDNGDFRAIRERDLYLIGSSPMRLEGWITATEVSDQQARELTTTNIPSLDNSAAEIALSLGVIATRIDSENIILRGYPKIDDLRNACEQIATRNRFLFAPSAQGLINWRVIGTEKNQGSLIEGGDYNRPISPRSGAFTLNTDSLDSSWQYIISCEHTRRAKYRYNNGWHLVDSAIQKYTRVEQMTTIIDELITDSIGGVYMSDRINRVRASLCANIAVNDSGSTIYHNASIPLQSAVTQIDDRCYIAATIDSDAFASSAINICGVTIKNPDEVSAEIDDSTLAPPSPPQNEGTEGQETVISGGSARVWYSVTVYPHLLSALLDVKPRAVYPFR